MLLPYVKAQEKYMSKHLPFVLHHHMHIFVRVSTIFWRVEMLRHLPNRHM